MTEQASGPLIGCVGHDCAACKKGRTPLSDERIDQIIASYATITDANLYGAIYMMLRELEASHDIEEQEA